MAKQNKTIKILLGIFMMLLILAGNLAQAAEIKTPNAKTQVSNDLFYDKNGNLMQGFGKYYEYDSFNQLAAVRENNASGKILEQYYYDGDGNRIEKIKYFANGQNETTYYIGNDFVQIVNSSGTFNEVYYYDETDLVAKKDSNGNMYYYHPDNLGSTSLITDSNGNIVEKTDYSAFGEVISGGNISRYTYTEKEKDATGLMYYEARYYDPYTKHFIQPDTIIQDPYDPQSLNRYSYVRNNPYKYTDPTGHLFTEIAIGLIVTATLYNLAKNIYDSVGYLTDNHYSSSSNPLKGNLVDKIINHNSCESCTQNIVPVDFGFGKVTEGGGKVVIENIGKKTEQIPIDKLWGHETTDPKNIFRVGAKTHETNPIKVIKIGEEYMIDDGVGTSMRALNNGEKTVNAEIIRKYSDETELNLLSQTSNNWVARNDKKYWQTEVSKINDDNRWIKLLFS